MKDYSKEIEARQIRANATAGTGNESVDAELLQSVLDADATLKLGNPATVQANRIAAFFKDDPDVTVSYQYEVDQVKNPGITGPLVQLFVTDADRADYLNRIIVKNYELGGINLTVQVVQAVAGDIVPMSAPSDSISLSGFEILKRALKGNPNVVNFREIYVALFDVTYCFAEFQSKTLFYQADDISNVEGFDAILPVDLAKEIFDTESIHCLFSTYVPFNKK